MASLLHMLVRGLAILGLLATALAIATARIVPHDRSERAMSASPYSAVNRLFLDPENPHVRILDSESGQVTNLALPKGENLQYGSFSDWVDETGHRQVVGVWSQLAGQELNTECMGVGLSRVLYPGGRVLDRITGLSSLPSGVPCWYPGTNARILYPAGDGLLYQYAFERSDDSDGPMPDDGVVQVPWTPGHALNSQLRILEVCWPKDPRFHGKLFAAVSSSMNTVDDQRILGPTRLWWLTLSGSGNAITAGGPLAPENSAVGRFVEQCVPSLSVAPDGTPVLVYQERLQGERIGEARLVRVEFDLKTGQPSIRPDQSVRVASFCKPVPATFTPRGDSFVLNRSDESGRSKLMRHAVADLLPSEPPSASVPR